MVNSRCELKRDFESLLTCYSDFVVNCASPAETFVKHF